MTIPHETIERVARAMCVADGNEPDRSCTIHTQRHLRGIAQSAVYLPTETNITKAWKLYESLAQVAIETLQETYVMYTKAKFVEVDDRNGPSSTAGFEQLAADILNESKKPDFLSINRGICS